MREDLQTLLRALPSVEEMAQSAELATAQVRHPRSLLITAVRTSLAEARAAILSSGDAETAARFTSRSALAARVAEILEAAETPSLRRVLNATGVVVHTNLGRSILAREALERVVEVAQGYSTLEYRLGEGVRGSRHEHVEGLLTELTGAEAAMVVNNNAAAVLLLLTALAREREVIVSRGQLVEIGGSFRIPDIMRASGARLVEVGTTNKTRIEDYAAAISPDTALLLRVHSSNFKIVGFVEEVDIAALTDLGASRGIPVADDLGSGALAALEVFAEEPSVKESLAQGADVVTFSGDKLLGGPQAGIVLGRASWVEAMKRHPLARAVRVDKMTLAALEGTLRLYRDPERALREIPTLRYLSRSPAETAALAEGLADLVRERLRKGGGTPEPEAVRVDVEATGAKAGGGALPLLNIPSHAAVVRIDPAAGVSVAAIERRMRMARHPRVPVVARVEHDALVLDVAALDEGELPEVAVTVAWAMGESGTQGGVRVEEPHKS